MLFILFALAKKCKTTRNDSVSLMRSEISGTVAIICKESRFFQNLKSKKMIFFQFSFISVSFP